MLSTAAITCRCHVGGADGKVLLWDMAVGLPPYDKQSFTENKIRNEWNPKQPQRPRY